MFKKIVWGAILAGAIFIGCQEPQLSVPFEHSIVLSVNNVDLSSQPGSLLQGGSVFYKKVINLSDYLPQFQVIQQYIQQVVLDSARVRIVNHLSDTAIVTAFVSADTTIDTTNLDLADTLAHIEIAPGDTVVLTGQDYMDYFNASGINTLLNDLIPGGTFGLYLLGEPTANVDVTVDSMSLFVKISGEQ